MTSIRARHPTFKMPKQTRSHGDRFVTEVFMGGDVIFGCDKRDAWQRNENMRDEIEKLFANHYGPNFNTTPEEVSKVPETVNWADLGSQLRKKCNIR